MRQTVPSSRSQADEGMLPQGRPSPHPASHLAEDLAQKITVVTLVLEAGMERSGALSIRERQTALIAMAKETDE